MDNDDKYCNVCSIINEHFMDEIDMCLTSIIRNSRAFVTVLGKHICMKH